MKFRSLTFVALAGLGVAAQAASNSFTNNTSVGIPDDAYNGTLASMASVPVVVSTNLGGAVSNVRVQVGMNHTWVGDLTLKLQSPAGTVVTLMSRPGFLEAADDGTGGPGNSCNLLATYPVTFQAGATTPAENMGFLLSSSDLVCRDDGVCSFAPNKGAAAGGTLSSFNAQDSSGTWRLLAGDSAAGDTGTIAQFILVITTLDPPPMRIAQSGTNVVIAWPTNYGSFGLQSKQFLDTNAWTSVGAAQSVSGTNYTVTLPATNAASYFRLRNQ